MTHRRLPATKPGLRLENQRGEEVRPACLGRSDLYDYLIDGRANERSYRLAADEARAICVACPLYAKCMTANRDEVWAKAILGERARPVVSERRTKEHSDRTQWRIEAVRRVLDNGEGLDEALQWTGLTPKGFYSWCRRNRLLDLYAALTSSEGRKPNQHRRSAA